jgi:hypothetical protein
MWLAATLACTPALDVKTFGTGDTGSTDDTDDTEPPTTTTTTTTTPGDDGPRGFVGSPCDRDRDCDYPGGTCLRDDEGFPRGTCSAACEQFCDDAEGFPTTFCAEIGALPSDVADLGAGACLSRCNFGVHPGTGCRPDYGCVEVARANDDDSTWVCLPGAASDLPDCLEDLAARGVPFEPTVLADEHPADDPSLTCHVEDPVRMFSGYEGIDLTYADGDGPESVVGACTLAHALADTLEDLAPEGVVRVRHLGTYNCRTIAGSASLSRHGYGDAIDLSGFDFDDGATWTLVDDWEHEVTTFDTEAGEWLFETAQSWHDDRLWNIILTPNYNSAHDDHLHVDLTPGSDFLGFRGPYVFGPSPWPGE